MPQILLHKQKLTPEQIEKLTAEGVIAIQTKKPEDFQFLDLRVPQIEMNDMVWALLDAADTKDQSSGDVRRKLVANLAKLANEKRAKTLATQVPGAGS
jgi:predicted secreted protein